MTWSRKFQRDCPALAMSSSGGLLGVKSCGGVGSTLGVCFMLNRCVLERSVSKITHQIWLEHASREPVAVLVCVDDSWWL